MAKTDLPTRTMLAPKAPPDPPPFPPPAAATGPADDRAEDGPDPKAPHRELTQESARALSSARERLRRGEKPKLAAAEVLELWRAMHEREWGFEDPDLLRPADRKKATGELLRWAARYERGRLDAAWEYLRSMIGRWLNAAESPSKKLFVVGATPRLATILKPGSVFYRDWAAERAQDGR